MERKELISTSPSGNPDYQYYLKSEADAVMDGLELQHKADAELIAADRRNMEQMKERINVLEKQSEVTDRMLQDMASNNNREFLPDSNKELGTELGTQLGTDHIVDANKMMWVSVKDRLPDECESVLLYNNADNGYAVAWAKKINGVWEFCDGEYNYPTDCFTHWMPLPSPPEDRKDA